MSTTFWGGFEKTAKLGLPTKLLKRYGAGSLVVASMGAATTTADALDAKYNISHSVKQNKDINVGKHALVGAAIGAIGGGAAQGALRTIRRDSVNMHRNFHNTRRRFNKSHGAGGRAWTKGYGTDLNKAKSSFGITGNETTKAEVKKKFRDLSKKHHPDMGGSEAKMKEVNSNWDQLSNSDWFGKLASLILQPTFRL